MAIAMSCELGDWSRCDWGTFKVHVLVHNKHKVARFLQVSREGSCDSSIVPLYQSFRQTLKAKRSRYTSSMVALSLIITRCSDQTIEAYSMWGRIKEEYRAWGETEGLNICKISNRTVQLVFSLCCRWNKYMCSDQERFGQKNQPKIFILMKSGQQTLAGYL